MLKRAFMKKWILLLASVFTAGANAGLLPYGVKVDIQTSTVTGDWGWTQCYSTAGNSSNISYASVLSGCNGDSLMMAIRKSGTDMFSILGAASYDTVTQFTDLSYNTQSFTGNDENGLSWYLNNYSWGFTELGNTVNQYSADTNLYFQGWNGDNDAPFNNLGLSYHSNANGLRGGWAFNNGTWTALNSTYERVWLTTNATQFEARAVSEPFSILLILAGLGLLSFKRRFATIDR